jgi:hypothetical protein
VIAWVVVSIVSIPPVILNAARPQPLAHEASL